MVITDIVGEDENHPVYKELARTNGIRHYNFLDSIISTSLTIRHYAVTEGLIKSLNYHAIACLHKGAGEYRNVQVIVGNYTPPSHSQVPGRMNELVATANEVWEESDPIALASFVIWGINHIHPFVNGNGRTARAMGYFILCMKLELKLGIHLPELIRTEYRSQYIDSLKEIDRMPSGRIDVTPLADLIKRVIIEAINTN